MIFDIKKETFLKKEVKQDKTKHKIQILITMEQERISLKSEQFSGFRWHERDLSLKKKLKQDKTKRNKK
jgi:hypothetical protein